MVIRSSIHAKGRDARKYLDESRRQIAQLLGADTHEIILYEWRNRIE